MLHDGVIKMEYYAQGLNAESRNYIWSASKSFTSTLVAMGVYDGKIRSLDDKVEEYAPQFAGTAYGETPILHVLMIPINHLTDRQNKTILGPYSVFGAPLPTRSVEHETLYQYQTHLIPQG